MPNKDVTVKVRLDRPLAERLRRVAQRRKTTRSKVLRDAIALAEREDERIAALGVLVAQAEEDRAKRRGKRPVTGKFRLG